MTASWQPIARAGVRVNVSPWQLRRHGFVAEVRELLAHTGLDPAQVGLEITEGTFIDDDKATQESLVALRGLGVSLMLDDFGTGYSSLSYLHRFPIIDALKIDRSFLTDGDRPDIVVHAVVGLCQAFSMRTCVEGVETVEQLRRMTELGCENAQGFYISRPIPEGKIIDTLRSWDAASWAEQTRAGSLTTPSSP